MLAPTDLTFAKQPHVRSVSRYLKPLRARVDELTRHTPHCCLPDKEMHSGKAVCVRGGVRIRSDGCPDGTVLWPSAPQTKVKLEVRAGAMEVELSVIDTREL